MTLLAQGGNLIVLQGDCPSEEAEALLQRLLAAPGAVVDLQRCESLHAAVIQVLLAAKSVVQLPAAETAIGQWMRLVLLPVVTH